MPGSARSTIFALASGVGRAGVAVYRLSGPEAGRALESLAGGPLPPARQACRRKLYGTDGELVDDGLVLWFPAPHSFTGEDVVELQLHGGRAVASAVTEALLDLSLRPAEPGEFSRRAFEAGKLDLTQAEAIADLVAADTAAQRRQALGQLGGGLGHLYEDWRQRLLRFQAHLEADIDFSDEDLPGGLSEGARDGLAILAAEIDRHLADGGRGERLREGLSVAIVGAPNVGKSSLLNRIAGRDAAIVSSQAGTTRDVIEVHLDLGGYPVVVADTAGLRDTAEVVEEEGVRRARARAESSDVRLVVFDAELLPELDDSSLGLVGEGSLVVVNKGDRAGREIPETIAGQAVLLVSALDGAGIDAMLTALQARAAAILDGTGAPAITRARHRVALEEAVAAIGRALAAPLAELAAEDVRMAVRAIGRITGRVDVEDMLDLVFREFCIGK
ncbi:tRNA uridine-5-carboxymethylaminomethyl(34) synthesis GTPase MnmE [Telmatospirillum sp.]|uniref:tRNA uridine-5-carboxymethylaminomethyl(34) synthesis GTPase MnmE n=1 Tax=Telmatospirillum sp. TaxID=2079197 RepID=UPI00284A3B78|nr:tRNA uridine-5-carboxymethylaminomethyl(34) synthesis GTPase MnmE [Telmatospirillum sp.]MDR3439598.1 tRNA uridine-5-carboxymethylaminomethyl(34) synthesis GTPase MnmE [Telmatospirillum sp.]